MAELLAGIALAAFLFASLLWSVYRAVTTAERLRINAICLSALTILLMLTLTYRLFGFMIPVAIALGVSAAIAIWTDPGWSKLLPFVQLLLALAVIILLPMQTA